MPLIPEELDCTVEEWDGNQIVEVLARATNPVIGRGAYEAARRLRPEARILLRQRARVIEDSGRD